MTAPKRGYYYTYTGRVAFPNGAPSIFDFAVQLSRICRYAGAGTRWWPVVLHTFVVCDLLPDYLKGDGLVHDSPEVISNDIPKPFKTDAIETWEVSMLGDIYNSLGWVLPTAEEHAIIKKADRDALCGEVYTVGTQALQQEYPRCPKAEELVVKYLEAFPPMECITPDGRAPIEFLRRFWIYSDLRKQKPGTPGLMTITHPEVPDSHSYHYC